MENKNKTKRAPAALFLTATLLVVMAGGSFSHQKIEAIKPIDDRTPTAVCQAYDGYRDRQNSDWGVDDVPKCAKQVQCQMKRSGFWDENGKPVKKAVYLPAKEDLNPEVHSKYLWYANLDSHILAWRRLLVIEKLGELRRHDNFKDTVKWFMERFETFRKEHPSKSEQEVFELYVDRFLAEPLACARWVDGSCMKTWDGTTREDGQRLKVLNKAVQEAKKALKSNKDDEELKKALKKALDDRNAVRDKGRDCMLNASLAKQVTLANRELHDEKGTEMQPIVCHRADVHQAVVFVTNNGVGCSLDDSGENFRMAGNSHHALGLGFDLADSDVAEAYLADHGIACDFVTNDKGHCSIAEENLDTILAGWGNRIDRWGRDAGKVYKFLTE